MNERLSVWAVFCWQNNVLLLKLPHNVMEAITSSSRILLRLCSTNLKLISDNVVSNFPQIIVNAVALVDKVLLTSFAESNMFEPTWLHIIIIDVTIYFILGSFCYLFHTSSLSLSVLFYRKYEKWKKSIFYGIDPHPMHKYSNPIWSVISASAT